MNARHIIIAAAMSHAYTNARRLGVCAQEAADEAIGVADFIKSISKTEYNNSEARHPHHHQHNLMEGKR